MISDSLLACSYFPYRHPFSFCHCEQILSMDIKQDKQVRQTDWCLNIFHSSSVQKESPYLMMYIYRYIEDNITSAENQLVMV